MKGLTNASPLFKIEEDYFNCDGKASTKLKPEEGATLGMKKEHSKESGGAILRE